MHTAKRFSDAICRLAVLSVEQTFIGQAFPSRTADPSGPGPASIKNHHSENKRYSLSLNQLEW